MSVRHSNKKRKNVARSRVSRLLQTVSRYISRDKYRDTSMNRDDTTFHRDSCDILTKNNILLVPNLYNNYSGLVKLRYFVKVVAGYALAKKGIDELLVIKINDVEFRDSRDTPRNCFSRFSRIHVIS